MRIAGASLGGKIKINGWVNLTIHPTAKVKLGEGVRINSGFDRNAVGGYRRTGIYVGKQAELQIGAGSGLSNCTIVSTQKVSIGEGVMIGGGANIYDTDFHPIQIEDRHSNLPANAAPVLIHNNAFIGGHTTILKGVTIGEGSVVGACSVVAKSIPAGEIWAGNPARKIRNVDSSA